MSDMNAATGAPGDHSMAQSIPFTSIADSTATQHHLLAFPPFHGQDGQGHVIAPPANVMQHVQMPPHASLTMPGAPTMPVQNAPGATPAATFVPSALPNAAAQMPGNTPTPQLWMPAVPNMFAAAAAVAAVESTPPPTGARPTFVNAKQYRRILKRREARERLEEYYRQKRVAEDGKPKNYQHESRHRHAMKRPRGPGGRFLTKVRRLTLLIDDTFLSS